MINLTINSPRCPEYFSSNQNNIPQKSLVGNSEQPQKTFENIDIQNYLYNSQNRNSPQQLQQNSTNNQMSNMQGYNINAEQNFYRSISPQNNKQKQLSVHPNDINSNSGTFNQQYVSGGDLRFTPQQPRVQEFSDLEKENNDLMKKGEQNKQVTVVAEITLQVPNGIDTITVYNNSDIYKLAYDFCLKNYKDDNYVEDLVGQIKKEIINQKNVTYSSMDENQAQFPKQNNLNQFSNMMINDSNNFKSNCGESFYNNCQMNYINTALQKYQNNIAYKQSCQPIEQEEGSRVKPSITTVFERMYKVGQLDPTQKQKWRKEMVDIMNSRYKDLLSKTPKQEKNSTPNKKYVGKQQSTQATRTPVLKQIHQNKAKTPTKKVILDNHKQNQNLSHLENLQNLVKQQFMKMGLDTNKKGQQTVKLVGKTLVKNGDKTKKSINDNYHSHNNGNNNTNNYKKSDINQKKLLQKNSTPTSIYEKVLISKKPIQTRNNLQKIMGFNNKEEQPQQIDILQLEQNLTPLNFNKQFIEDYTNHQTISKTQFQKNYSQAILKGNQNSYLSPTNFAKPSRSKSTLNIQNELSENSQENSNLSQGHEQIGLTVDQIDNYENELEKQRTSRILEYIFQALDGNKQGFLSRNNFYLLNLNNDVKQILSNFKETVFRNENVCSFEQFSITMQNLGIGKLLFNIVFGDASSANQNDNNLSQNQQED